MDEVPDFGAILRALREKEGLTQEQTAERLHCTPQAVSLREKSKRELRISQIFEYARAIGYEFLWEFRPRGRDRKDLEVLLTLVAKLNERDVQMLIEIASVLPRLEALPREMLVSQVEILRKSSLLDALVEAPQRQKLNSV